MTVTEIKNNAVRRIHELNKLIDLCYVAEARYATWVSEGVSGYDDKVARAKQDLDAYTALVEKQAKALGL